MECKLISPMTASIARWLGLVHAIEVAQLEDDSEDTPWVILVRGKGFNRLIRDAPAPVWAPIADQMPHPQRFRTRERAELYGMDMRLLPRVKQWRVTDRPRSSTPHLASRLCLPRCRTPSKP